jgi:hypothetical protein
MDEASDDKLAPPPMLVHAGFTLEKVQMHLNSVMTEEHSAPSVSVFQHAQGDQCHNFRILDEHRLTEGLNAGEQANDNGVTTMVSEDSCFLDE